ncbi:MAG: hypothetical protein EBU84_10370 [Actinobacteria bacterium]|nr:hypothetical protein [Actinomycetota bacterium]
MEIKQDNLHKVIIHLLLGTNLVKFYNKFIQLLLDIKQVKQIKEQVVYLWDIKQDNLHNMKAVLLLGISLHKRFKVLLQLPLGIKQDRWHRVPILLQLEVVLVWVLQPMELIMHRVIILLRWGILQVLLVREIIQLLLDTSLV